MENMINLSNMENHTTNIWCDRLLPMISPLPSNEPERLTAVHAFDTLLPAVRRAMNEVKERAERTRLETQVAEAKKMEQLVSSVAHDFNNMLTVIISYNDLIMSEISPESPLRAYSEEIQNASKRAAGLAQQLLAAGRKKTNAILVK